MRGWQKPSDWIWNVGGDGSWMDLGFLDLKIDLPDYSIAVFTGR